MYIFIQKKCTASNSTFAVVTFLEWTRFLAQYYNAVCDHLKTNPRFQGPMHGLSFLLLASHSALPFCSPASSPLSTVQCLPSSTEA